MTTRLRWDKAAQQRKMRLFGTEKFALRPEFELDNPNEKRRTKRSKGTKTITGSKAQLAGSQPPMSLSVHQINAQKKRAARRKARKLLAKHRKLARKGLWSNKLGAANTASGQSVKQFAKLQKRNNGRMLTVANGKKNPRLKNPVKPKASRKSERKK